MTSRNGQSSVSRGRTEHVRPLPRLSRPTSTKSELLQDIAPKVAAKGVQPASSKVASASPGRAVKTHKRVVHSAHPRTHPKPLRRHLPLDHFVDGIAPPAKPVVSHKQKQVELIPASPVIAPVVQTPAVETTTKVQTHRHTEPSTKAHKHISRKLFGRVTQGASYALASLVMVFFGWLAYDTWETNRGIEEVTGASGSGGGSSQVQAALAQRYDETRPKGDPLKNYVVAPDLPRAIYIEKFDVKAKVIRVGVTKDNAMATPKSIYETGWYDGSSKPGEVGAVVVNGHVSGPTQHGVFYNLKKLVAGDVLTLEKGDGTKLNYSVDLVKKVAVKDLNMTELIVAEPGKRVLHLITCGGKFNAVTQQYEDRVVVFATQI